MSRVFSFVAALGVAATLVLPAAALAQNAPAPVTAPATRPHHRHGSAYMRALRRLNLSDAQKQQIRQAMRNEQIAMRKQIDGVLMPDQRTQLRSALQQARTNPPRT